MTTQAKTPRGPVPNLTLPPLKERNKTAAKAYYEANKLLIAQRRVYKRVKKNGIMPHSKTMKAMGLSINADGELTGFSPDLLTAKQVVFVPAVAQPATLTQKPVEIPAGTVNSVEAVRYVQEHYEKASFATKAKYNSFYTTLKRLKLIKERICKLHLCGQCEPGWSHGIQCKHICCAVRREWERDGQHGHLF